MKRRTRLALITSALVSLSAAGPMMAPAQAGPLACLHVDIVEIGTCLWSPTDQSR